jgi:hypothetical protein
MASVLTSAASSSEISGEGDMYLLEKASTKVWVGNGLTDIVSATVDEDELPVLLKEGKFRDNDNDEFDYTQKVTLSNLSVTMFDDNDYKEDTPTIGIRIASGSPVLNYTLTMSDQPRMDDLETSDLPILGKEYYVLSAPSTNVSVTLLDSAEKVVLTEGTPETVTINGKTYECSISYISTTEVKLTVNGETTNSLAEAQTYKLSDGTYIGIRDIMARDVAGTTGQVEFGIGSGKLKITNASDVEMNDDSISRLTGYIGVSSTGTLTSLTLEWKADGDLFVAPGAESVMPGFKAVKLLWDKVSYPLEENIVVKQGGDDYMVLEDFPTKESTEDVYLVYTNSTDGNNITGVGKDASNILKTSSTSTLHFFYDTDEYFVASWADSRDAESYLVRAANFKKENGVNKTTFEYKKDGTWTTFGSTDRKDSDTVSKGNVEFTVTRVSYDGRNVTISASSGTNFNSLYSKEGLKVYLPYTLSTMVNTTTVSAACSNAVWATGRVGELNVSNTYGNESLKCYNSTWNLVMSEENKDGDVAKGGNVTAVVGFNAASTAQVHVASVAGGNPSFVEIGNTDVEQSVVYSALATDLLWDKGGDQDWLKAVYHGGESTVKSYLAAPSVTTTATSTVTPVLVSALTAADKAKNLIVVGGSCINTVAAKLLTGLETPLCAAEFSAKTGVGAGQYMIKGFTSPYATDKIAVLVAGYEAAQTVDAVKAAKALDSLTKTTNVVAPKLA